MIEQLTFGQIHLIWPIVFAAALLWLVFFWKEWTGKTGGRFYMKIFVGMIAILALALIALQPQIRTAEKVSYTGILSQGYQMAQQDSLKKVHKKIRFVHYRPGQDLSTDIKKGQKVFILGNGLASYDLWQLDGTQVFMLSAIALKGVSRLKYEPENVVGNDFIVSGEYRKASKDHQLLLTGPGGTPLDSLRLNDSEIQRFGLKAQHLVEGKFVYTLIEKDSTGNLLSASPLAVSISAKAKLKVLIVNQYPSFETKYLKNYLAESGHQVMVRSQVSTNRYKYEYFNSLQRGTIGLTSETLSDVDLLIIDLASMQMASKNILESLQTAIKKQGLGVFIQADADAYNGNIPLIDFSFLKQADKEVIVDIDPETVLGKHPYIFKKEPLLETIYSADKGIVMAYKRFGSGRIGTTVLQNTYELILEGNTRLYQTIWSRAISMISKRKPIETDWEQGEMMVYQDAPFEFQLKTVQEEPVVRITDESRIPLARDMELTQVWRGTTFPRELGWNQLLLEQDSTAALDFYVMDTTQWISLNAAKRVNANLRYFDDQELTREVAGSQRPIKLWWFFIIFLLAMSFLWLEPKL